MASAIVTGKNSNVGAKRVPEETADLRDSSLRWSSFDPDESAFDLFACIFLSICFLIAKCIHIIDMI